MLKLDPCKQIKNKKVLLVSGVSGVSGHTWGAVCDVLHRLGARVLCCVGAACIWACSREPTKVGPQIKHVQIMFKH